MPSNGVYIVRYFLGNYEDFARVEIMKSKMILSSARHHTIIWKSMHYHNR